MILSIIFWGTIISVMIIIWRYFTPPKETQNNEAIDTIEKEEENK